MQILLEGPSLSFLEHVLNTAAVVQRVAVHVTYCCESRLLKSWLSFFVRFWVTWPPADLVRHHPSAFTYSSFWRNSCLILLPFSSQLHAGPCIIDTVSWGVPCFMQIIYLAMLLQKFYFLIINDSVSCCFWQNCSHYLVRESISDSFRLRHYTMVEGLQCWRINFVQVHARQFCIPYCIWCECLAVTNPHSRWLISQQKLEPEHLPSADICR